MVEKKEVPADNSLSSVWTVPTFCELASYRVQAATVNTVPSRVRSRDLALGTNPIVYGAYTVCSFVASTFKPAGTERHTAVILRLALLN